VIRKPVSRTQLCAEVKRRLPFDAEIMICHGRDILRLLSQDFFASHQVEPDIVRFVSILSRLPRSEPDLPLALPSAAAWLVKVLARDDRFVLGMYRRDMKTIGYLGTIDRMFGVPLTTRNWNTITAIGKLLVGKDT